MDNNKAEPFIFTEAFNCGELIKPFVESYTKYNDRPIHVFLSEHDMKGCSEYLNHSLIIPVNLSEDKRFSALWDYGHAGTAMCFTHVIKNIVKNGLCIHIDSDVLFRDNCVDEIYTSLLQGFSLVGPTRPYKNNRNGRTDLIGPDLIATCCFGMDCGKIPDYTFDVLHKMCQGYYNPTGEPILDFFDPVSMSVLKNGGSIKYLSNKDYGGPDEYGSLDNGYESNKHIDFGNKFIHFAGVGSGCAVANGRSTKCHSGYGQWATKRWLLYSKIVFDSTIELDNETNIIYETIVKDIK